MVEGVICALPFFLREALRQSLRMISQLCNLVFHICPSLEKEPSLTVIDNTRNTVLFTTIGRPCILSEDSKQNIAGRCAGIEVLCVLTLGICWELLELISKVEAAAHCLSQAYLRSASSDCVSLIPPSTTFAWCFYSCKVYVCISLFIETAVNFSLGWHFWVCIWVSGNFCWIMTFILIHSLHFCYGLTGHNSTNPS